MVKEPQKEPEQKFGEGTASDLDCSKLLILDYALILRFEQTDGKTYRVLTLLLLSIAIAASVILFTVGLDHEHLGPERKWTYPLFCPDTSIYFTRGIRYVFHRKSDPKIQISD